MSTRLGVSRSIFSKKRMNSTWPMALHTAADDRSQQDIERGKQRGSAVAGIVVGLAFGQAGAQRQNRLGTIERLNLALLVYAQHQRFVRRIEVQADHIAQLGDEVGIGTELE